MKPLDDPKAVEREEPKRAEWLDYNNTSRLSVHDAFLWRDFDGKWVSNTPPLFGGWATREQGKAALVEALRKRYTDLLAQLPKEDA